jgi:hypothetical protein
MMFEPHERKADMNDHERRAEALKKAQADIGRAYDQRLATILKCRAEGMNNRQIGLWLGITEAAVRSIVKRANATGLLDSPEWAALSPEAQAWFMILNGRPTSGAGIIDYRLPRILAGIRDLELTAQQIESASDELEQAGMIVVDHEIEDALIPSKIQFTIKAAGDYYFAGSPTLRRAFVAALRAKHDADPDLKVWQQRHVSELLGTRSRA